MPDNEQKGVAPAQMKWLSVLDNVAPQRWDATWGKVSVSVSTFPGCCGIAIVYKLDSLQRESVGDGVRKLHAIAERAFDTFNVGMLMATHNTLRYTDNLRTMFERAGWTESQPFLNPNSGNAVVVFTLRRI